MFWRSVIHVKNTVVKANRKTSPAHALEEILLIFLEETVINYLILERGMEINLKTKYCAVTWEKHRIKIQEF